MSLDLSPVNIEGRNIIQSYGNGKFQINDKQFDHSILVFSDQIIPWAPIDPNNLIIDDFKKAQTQRPRLQGDAKGRKLVAVVPGRGPIDFVIVTIAGQPAQPVAVIAVRAAAVRDIHSFLQKFMDG